MLKPKRVVLFSSYFTTPSLPYFIKYYLEQLRPHAAHIVFITTDDKPLLIEDKNWLHKNVEQVMLVKNEGFDFGMWQKALNQTEIIGQFDELVLANDSCVCFNKLDDYFNWHEQSSADVTGMTISNYVKPHIQSFFITAKTPSLSAVIEYIKSLPLSNSKFSEVITMGEIGLSSSIISQGFSISALFTPRPNNFKNPMYFNCYDLVADYRIPLIKRKLFYKYHSGMVRNLSERTDNYTHRVLLNFIQEDYGICEQEMAQLFTTPPVQLSLKSKIKFKLKSIIYKLGRHKKYKSMRQQ